MLHGANDVVRPGEHVVLEVLGVRRGQVGARNTHGRGVEVVECRGCTVTPKDIERERKSSKRRQEKGRVDVLTFHDASEHLGANSRLRPPMLDSDNSAISMNRWKGSGRPEEGMLATITIPVCLHNRLNDCIGVHGTD